MKLDELKYYERDAYELATSIGLANAYELLQSSLAFA
jgi:hypothetical protein